MSRTLILALSAALLSTAPTFAQAVDYEFDKSHTIIRASWDHQEYSTMSLQLTAYDGTLSLDLENPSNSAVDITFNLIDGIWPGAHHDRFIAHLNSADFFETAVNPTAHFVATGFETDDGTHGVMSGDLTMNGMTNPVALDVTLNRVGENRGRAKLGFTATATITRSQWDMAFAVPHIPDDIELFISMEILSITE